MNKAINNRTQILDFGRELMSISDTDKILELISTQIKTLLNAQRCSIFIVDKETDTLWTKLSDEIEMIVIPLDSGIVGETYKAKKAQITNSPYDEVKFMKNIDKKVDFKTKNIIAVPIFNSQKEIIAILELLNKKESDFNNDDLDTLVFFANFVSAPLELSLMENWLKYPQI